MQPYEGAKEGGGLGFIKGLGKGFVGVLSKPVAGMFLCSATLDLFAYGSAGILGVPAYTYKGIHKELRKSRGKPLQEFIMAARTADGLEDWTASTEEERGQIISRWQEIQPELKKVKSYLEKHPSQSTPTTPVP